MTAFDQGWGMPGTKSFVGKIIPIKAAGIYLRVNSETAPLWKAALDQIAAHGGYDFAGVADDWGANVRPIRGYEDEWARTKDPKYLSNHSWGNAVDLNSTTNPMTENPRIHGDMPQWVVAIFAEYGILWGGNYKGKRKDYMHFEFVGTPAEARRRVANLRTPRQAQKELFTVGQYEDIMNAIGKNQQRLDEIHTDVAEVRAKQERMGGDNFEFKNRLGIPDGPPEQHPRTGFNSLVAEAKG
jgi:hypothetical protein